MYDKIRIFLAALCPSGPCKNCSLIYSSFNNRTGRSQVCCFIRLHTLKQWNIASFVRDLIKLIKFMFSSEAEGYKTKNISLRFRVNYSFLLFYSPQYGSQVWTWLFHGGPIGSKKLQLRNYFCSFYSFELKLWSMVELRIPGSSMFVVKILTAKLKFQDMAKQINNLKKHDASLFAVPFEKLHVNDKITASCQTNMSHKPYIQRYKQEEWP